MSDLISVDSRERLRAAAPPTAEQLHEAMMTAEAKMLMAADAVRTTRARAHALRLDRSGCQGVVL